MLLEIANLHKSFGPISVLHGVDLGLHAGEVLALVGDNGAGKSTLIKHVAGVYKADSGEIRLNGAKLELHTPADARRLGIETVYQDLALCDNLDVVANMFLGRETVSAPAALRRLSELDMERRALDVLRQLNVTTIKSVRSPVATLSGGQRQSVAISRAVMWNSKIVLLDEPTAALGVAQTFQVRELIKRLRTRGLGVVLISHNLHDVFEVADRIIVLRLGRRVATFKRDEATPDDVVASITGARRG